MGALQGVVHKTLDMVCRGTALLFYHLGVVYVEGYQSGAMKGTVITFGTFDLLHIGHVHLLRRASQLGARLVVGVSTDELTYKKKGKPPVFSHSDRIEIVRSLRFVDHVFDEEQLSLKKEYVHAHKADLLVMGSDWQGHFDDLRSICEVVYLPRTPNISTTEILKSLTREHTSGSL
jgi:glycerol-3-phosphate cytidylyltransferase